MGKMENHIRTICVAEVKMAALVKIAENHRSMCHVLGHIIHSLEFHHLVGVLHSYHINALAPRIQTPGARLMNHTQHHDHVNTP